jgi:hypothetical protein
MRKKFIGVIMKIYWSAFLLSMLLLSFIGCSKEQFGSTPSTAKKAVDPIRSFEYRRSCSENYTLIKPKVDILYVVDNSASVSYLQNDIRSAITNTVNSISSQFDYRVIGTNLINPKSDSTPFNDFQVLTNSSDLQGIPADSRRISSSSSFDFFSRMVDGSHLEQGLSRVYDFINNNKQSGLFREQTHLIVVLISNGRDTDVETALFSNGQTQQDADAYNQRLTKLKSLKSELKLHQLRLFSIVAKGAKTGNCSSGWLSSEKSYEQASRDIYQFSGASDSSSSDSYDLCPQGGGLGQVYTGVNNSIRQVVLPHTYKYWPITFAENNETVDFNQIEVFKESNGSSSLMAKSSWSYYENKTSSAVNIRIEPTVGEPINGRHFIEFNSSSYIKYPDCVVIRSKSRVEYFGYVVLPQAPKPQSIVLRINGVTIPQSATNGWSYSSSGQPMTRNTKVAHPNPGDENPPVIKTGFMIQLHGTNNFFRSGDNVEVYYDAAGI